MSCRGRECHGDSSALGSAWRFLEQCRREDSFETLRAQQYEVLVTNLKALGRVPFEEGSRLVGLLQKQPWSESQRTALIAMVQEKVVAHAATTASSAKVERQNWTNLAMFLREEDWCRLMNPHLQGQSLCLHLREISGHLHKLTLRYPTEDVYSMVTVPLLLHDQGRFLHGPSLRSSYLSTKTQMKAFMSTLLKNDDNKLPLLKELPGDPSLLPDDYRVQAFGENGKPAPLPKNVSMDQLLIMSDAVPQGGNHSSLKISLPQIGKNPFVPQPAWAPWQHQQHYAAMWQRGLFFLQSMFVYFVFLN